jgi:hypothetical protein
MKIGSSLALICVGAILAFAVTATPSFFNLHTAGWVIMLVGVIGLLLPNRTAGWLGRRLLVPRSYPSGRAGHVPVPSYVARNPGTQALEAGLPSRPTLLDPEDDLIENTGSGYEEIQEAEPDAYPSSASRRQSSGQRPGTASQRPGPGVTEVIEDLYQQP